MARHAPTSPLDDDVVQEARAREDRGLSQRELAVAILMSGSLVLVGEALAGHFASHRNPSYLLVALLVAAAAGLSRVEFEVGAGAAVPMQLALVPMLFLLPTGLVPLCVAAAYALSALATRRPRVDHAILLVGAAWFSVGPALVLCLAGEGPPRLSRAPLYALAFAGQFALDLAASTLREWLAFGHRPGLPVRAVLWAYAVDAALAPLGLLAAIAALGSPWALAALAPLAVLLGIFARERRMRIDHAIDLSTAYRGSALLLGDPVEADDAYTSEHSHGVVALTLAVADELGLDASSAATRSSRRSCTTSARSASRRRS